MTFEQLNVLLETMLKDAKDAIASTRVAQERVMGKIRIMLEMREDNDPQGKYTGLHRVDMRIFVRGFDDRPEYDGNVTQEFKVTAIARTMDGAKQLARSRAIAYCTDVIDAVRNYDVDRAKTEDPPTDP